jgi:T5SS/PEP-CTERM-associated repeat protein/autotransporter-associated beta strand protein
LLLVNLLFKTICSNRRTKSCRTHTPIRPALVLAAMLALSILGAGSAKAQGTGQIPDIINETVTVPSATFAADQTIPFALFVGGPGGVGTLHIVEGGTVTSGEGHVGYFAPSEGTVTVTGPNATWANNGIFTVGANGTGTLTIQNGGTVKDSTAFIGVSSTGVGTVTVSGPDSTWTISGNLSVGSGGKAELTIQNNGLVHTDGTVTIASSGTGTLNIGAAPSSSPAAPGTLETSKVIFGPGGTINFNHTATNYLFAPAISGPGEVNVLAGTTILLNDNNTYSGGTTMSGGTLVVGTLLVGADQPISTALGTGNVFLDPGTLRTTSASTGVPVQINVGGNYTQAAGGTLALGIGGLPGEQYDHVQVEGNATVSGNLVVSSLNGFHPSADNAFEVLHTNGTLKGNFTHLDDSAFNNNPNLTPALRLQAVEVVAPNGILLVYLPHSQPIPPTTPPGTSPPTIIDVVPEPLPPVDPEEPFPTAPLVTFLDPTAEQLTSLFEIGFSAANAQRIKLDERFDQIQRDAASYLSNTPPPPVPATGKEIASKQPAPPPPPPEKRWGVWANGWGDWVTVDNSGFAKGYNFTVGGFIAGVDYRITDNFAVGIFGGYSHTWTNLQPSGSIRMRRGRNGDRGQQNGRRRFGHEVGHKRRAGLAQRGEPRADRQRGSRGYRRGLGNVLSKRAGTAAWPRVASMRRILTAST